MSVDALIPLAVPASEVRERLDELLVRAAEEKERVVLTRDGRPVAALVPIDDVDILERIEDQIDLVEARKALEEWEAKGRPTVPLEDILKELGLSA